MLGSILRKNLLTFNEYNMKDNKKIAEFMGMTYGDTNDESVMIQMTNTGNEVVPIESMEYHNSWDWLMPVVDKIEREHKANFRIKCTWNEFTEYSIHQVIVNIEQGEMSKDKSCIYDSKKIYDYVGDAVKCKREATYQAVVEFINEYNKTK
tara:strand:- start:359 stop:811 length:453 start_codon:yes stop_codon:yes gene_type:complete